MQKRIPLLLVILLPAALVAVGIFLFPQRHEVVIQKNISAQVKVVSIDAAQVDAAIRSDDDSFNVPHARGLIVPHHDIASELVAKSFAGVQEKPQIVVIIGPDHEEAGLTPITTGMITWETVFGSVGPAYQLVARLTRSPLVTENNTVVANEHAISVLQPFVAYYFPGAMVVPILLKKNQSADALAYLERYIQVVLKNYDVLIVGSVDFSHYVSVEVATERDAVTKDLIATQAYDTLLGVDHEYCDSPATVVSILRALNASNTTVSLHAEKNLVDYMPYNPAVLTETTSYLVFSVD